MVIFFVTIIICVFVGYIIACRWEVSNYIAYKVNVILSAVGIGLLLGVGLSFLGGSFVKKEIIEEEYFISPMIFDGKPIVALREDGLVYIFQVNDNKGTRLIKRCLSKKEIFFTDDSEGRYLKVRRSKTCGKNLWIWFFYGGTGIIESKAVLKKGDSFLTLPRYYSL